MGARGCAANFAELVGNFVLFYFFLLGHFTFFDFWFCGREEYRCKTKLVNFLNIQTFKLINYYIRQ